MSDPVEPRLQLLTDLGRLKVATRLIRFGQALTPVQFKILMFIFDRTVSWNRPYAIISKGDFRDGVKSRRENELKSLPVGIPLNEVRAALTRLVEIGAITRNIYPTRTYYAINYDWHIPGLMPMWEVLECDYTG